MRLFSILSFPFSIVATSLVNIILQKDTQSSRERYPLKIFQNSFKL